MAWILWYLAGLATIPLLITVHSGLRWMFSKTTGTGDCVTDCKGSRDMELGEHFNITVWAEGLWHRVAWSSRPTHKEAVRLYWQGIHDLGGQYRTDVGVHD